MVVAAVFTTVVVVAATFTLRVNFTVEEVEHDFACRTAASVENADSARFEHCNCASADSAGKHHIYFLLEESVDNVGFASATFGRIEFFLADYGLCFIVNLPSLVGIAMLKIISCCFSRELMMECCRFCQRVPGRAYTMRERRHQRVPSC